MTITGLDVIYGQDTPPPPGYTKIDVDINKGAGGEYIYLCYSKEPGEPITSIQVFASDSSDFQIQSGYTKIDKDLNKGAGGKYIYMGYSRNKTYLPIAEVGVIQGSDRLVYPPNDQWVRINQDCNEGAGGVYTYVSYKMTNLIQELEQKVKDEEGNELKQKLLEEIRQQPSRPDF